MKRKFILLPITLTALAPTICMIGCNNEPIPPDPEDCVVLDNFSRSEYYTEHLVSTEKFLIKENTSYCFKIDVNRGEQPKEAGYYAFSSISIQAIDKFGRNLFACKLTNDFQIGIDGNLLDSSLWKLGVFPRKDSCIEIDPKGLEQILNAKESVMGRIHASTLVCEPTDECFFDLYAEEKA